jgi:hypothetical protein
MSQITFTSVLERRHRRELERLLFLNPGQHRVRSAIIKAVEQYGIPRVVEEQGRLRVRLDSGREVQTVFAIGHTALRSILAGVIVYTRLETQIILLMHMAVTGEYASRGCYGGQNLALQLVERLRTIARQVRGVRTVRLILGNGKVWDAPV